MSIAGGSFRPSIARYHAWWLAAAVVAMATALGLFEVGSKSLWYDEAVSVAYARSGLADTLSTVTSRDANGAIYYLVLVGWVQAVGTGEGAVRALSVLLAVGAVGTLWHVGRRLFDVWVATLAAVVLATNGFFLSWAQEARSYAMAVFIAVLATDLLLSACHRRALRWWIAYGIAVGIGVYAHLFIGLVMVAHAAWLVLRPDRASLGWRGPFLGFAVAAFVSAPMLLFVVSNPGPTWIASLSLDSIRWTTISLAGSSLVLLAASVLALVWAMVRVRTSATTRDQRTRLLLPVLWTIVPFGLAVGISIIKPMLHPRYLIVILPGTALTIAAVAGGVRSRVVRTALAVAVISASVTTTIDWYGAPAKEDWRAVVQALAKQAAPGDAVVVYPSYKLAPFEYYADRLGVGKSLPRVIEAGSVSPLGSGSRLFLVMSYAYTGTTPADLGKIFGSLEAAGYRSWGKDRAFNGVKYRLFIMREHEPIELPP